MKKKLASIFLAILILLVVVYFFRYKRALDFENRIPNSATEVIHINIRQLEHHVLADFLKHPFDYISFESSGKKKDSLSLINALDIPRNLLLFTNDTEFKGVWLSSIIKIKNYTEFSEYILREGFKKVNHKSLELFSRGSIVLGVRENNLLISYGSKGKNIIAVIESVFNEVDFLSEESDVIKPMIASKSDINYSNLTNDYLEANFKDGFFEILGTMDSDLFLSEDHKELSKNSVAFVNAKLNTKHKLFKAFTKSKASGKVTKITKLSLDSIVKHWDGKILFDVKSIKSKVDTIVTYDYDDDFNKVETKSTQKLIVPDLELELYSGKDSSLYHYFIRKKAIQVIEADTLFTSMPLYKLYARSGKNKLQISTEKGFLTNPSKEKESRLNAYVNIEKYVQNPLDFYALPSESNYLQLFKDAKINLSDKNELSVKVNLKNSDRNVIGQIIKP